MLERLPVSYLLPGRLLFLRHGKHKCFRFFPWRMSSGSLVIFTVLLSTSKVAGIFLKSSAPNWTRDSSWALTNMEITPCRLYSHMHPNIVLFFFSFLSCNSSTLPIHVQLEIHSNPYPFLKSCCLTSCSPACIGVKSYQHTAQWTLWSYVLPLSASVLLVSQVHPCDAASQNARSCV